MWVEALGPPGSWAAVRGPAAVREGNDNGSGKNVDALGASMGASVALAAPVL